MTNSFLYVIASASVRETRDV